MRTLLAMLSASFLMLASGVAFCEFSDVEHMLKKASSPGKVVVTRLGVDKEVLLYGIEVPESNPLAVQAFYETMEKFEGDEVYLEARPMQGLYIYDIEQDTGVNEALVCSGAAIALDRNNQALLSCEQEAKKKKIGLWDEHGSKEKKYYGWRKKAASLSLSEFQLVEKVMAQINAGMMPDQESLMKSYCLTHDEVIGSTLENSDILPRDYEAIRDNKIYIGMPIKIVTCIMGPPDEINTYNHGAAGMTMQYVYRTCKICSGVTYIYIDDTNRVTAIQSFD